MRNALGLAVAGLVTVTTGAVPAVSAEHAAKSWPAVQVHKITTGGYPGETAIDQRAGVLWAPNGAAVLPVRESTRRVITRIRFAASKVAVDPSRGLVWAADQANGTLAEISTRTYKIIRRVPSLGDVQGIAIDPGTRTVWVTNVSGVVELSEITGRVLHTMTLVSRGVAKAAVRLAVDPVTRTVWVAVVQAGRRPTLAWIAEIKESRHRVSRRFDLGVTNAALAVDPASGIVWVAGGGTTAYLITESTGTMRTLSNIPNNANGVAIDHRAHVVVVTDNTSGTNDVYLVSETTKKVTAKIKVGFFPSWAAVDPVTGNAYVSIAFRGVIVEFQV